MVAFARIAHEWWRFGVLLLPFQMREKSQQCQWCLSVILLVVATKARRRDGLEEVEVAAEGCVCLSLYGEEAEIVGVERGKSEPEPEPAQVCSCLVL